MRTKKFKVWDEKHKQMVLPENTNVLTPSFEDGEFVVGFFPDDGDYYNLELLEYSGLKDKNGKEVYFDCSIMKFKDSVFMLQLYDEEHGFICPSIKWIKNERWLEWSYEEFACDKSYDCVIIGTMFENPELI